VAVTGSAEQWSATVEQRQGPDGDEDEKAAEAEPVRGDGERRQPGLAAEQVAEQAARAPGDAGEDEQGNTGATGGDGGSRAG